MISDLSKFQRYPAPRRNSTSNYIPKPTNSSSNYIPNSQVGHIIHLIYDRNSSFKQELTTHTLYFPLIVFWFNSKSQISSCELSLTCARSLTCAGKNCCGISAQYFAFFKNVKNFQSRTVTILYLHFYLYILSAHFIMFPYETDIFRASRDLFCQCRKNLQVVVQSSLYKSKFGKSYLEILTPPPREISIKCSPTALVTQS